MVQLNAPPMPMPGLTEEDAAFRDEVRAWLEEHLIGDFLEFGGRGAAASDEGFDLRARWERELASGGWLGLAFPKEYGGRGLGIGAQIVFAYECARMGAPYRLSIQGTEMIGPTIAMLGTPEQKQRFLPDILAANVIWSQGFSEPGAGSDLANVRTTARLDGDSWVVDGQKVWTTFGHHADWIYVLARTNPDAARHKGLSLLLVPMDQPGVEVRPIVNMARSAEFCEVFFDGARTMADLVVGEVDGGWATAMTVLGLERATATLPHQMQFERELDDVIERARASRRLDDPVLRQRVMQAWIGLRVLACNNARSLTALMQTGRAGPQSSIGKIYWSEWHQRLCELKLDVLGPEAMRFDYAEDAVEAHRMQHTFLLSRAETIYGGSNQIQRNTVGERVLGLPKEPKV
jgi:alkylation response protein AidB-like acyl-CoA dehydrogenase